ncbi:hypothetical protein TraAM80_05919 [Trypanosoma rangeli]|uniref:Secreted protein n=1 Tax=Trypanosoma rangeli TaxID=5698 RepID=A0A422NCI2_TRYRA|nr:uncharacterized protein TraAM80_05919 [Trypanosoma rangeli]RNF03185.1 hypothetical protein TraAM80_05919 [Trypanosoma rangeli]|eukprot:RNF03185.1 hypothetical protein TraAM80_05919 [Trypanosoma rangeli]
MEIFLIPQLFLHRLSLLLLTALMAAAADDDNSGYDTHGEKHNRQARPQGELARLGLGHENNKTILICYRCRGCLLRCELVVLADPTQVPVITLLVHPRSIYHHLRDGLILHSKETFWLMSLQGVVAHARYGLCVAAITIHGPLE